MSTVRQKALDRFYDARRWIVDVLAFLTLRVYAKEVTFTEVANGTYAPACETPHNQDGAGPGEPLNLDEAKDVDTLLDVSKECLSNAQKRRSDVTDKCKTLCTVASLLLGVIGLTLPKYLEFESWAMRGIAVVAVALLFTGITILLKYFDVGKETTISLGKADVPLDGTDLKKSLVNQCRRCEEDANYRTDFLVDLYSAARFCFFSALTLVAILVLSAILTSHPTDAAKRLVEEIRSDSDLIELLRGPKGLVGSKGDPGLQGAVGPQGGKGEKGDRGDSPSVDEYITRLLSNPRFGKLIEEAVENHTKVATPE
jgi:hypothetical protein